MNRKECFTCKDMLFLPSMKGSKIIAGKNGIDCPISKVNTLEMPDIIDWLHGGEFLITTAYAFKEDLNKLTEAISNYKAKGVCGIAIKPKRYVEITQELIDACNKYAFPLITLPFNSIFADIVKESIECILQRQTNQLYKAQNIVDELMHDFSHNKSMPQLLQTLQKKLCRKILLLNDYELICVEDFIIDHNKFINDNIDKIEKGGLQSLNINSVVTNSYIYNCDSSNRTYLIALESNQCFNINNINIIKRVFSIMEIEIRNMRSITDMKSKYQNWFFRTWLLGEFKNVEDILSSAKSYGVNITNDNEYSVCIVRLKSLDKNQEPLKYKMKFLQRKISAIDKNILVFGLQDLTLILPAKSNKELNINIYRNIKRCIEEILSDTVFLCISSSYKIISISDGYKEAKEILKIAEQCDINKPYLTSEDLGIYSLLSLITDNIESIKFKNKFLKNIIEYDQEHGTKLLETLKQYYQYNCNAKLTAKNSFTHYNTILYRLERIKEIINMDIDDSEIKLQLQIALKLNEIQ